MEEFNKEMDDRLFAAKKGYSKEDITTLWNEIKNNPKLLWWAVQPSTNRFSNPIVKGLAISECILLDHDNVDQDVYATLIDLIFSNRGIARIVQTGASNGGDSYLLLALMNHNLKLTEEQKDFAVKEAMNKIGTTEYAKKAADYSKKLDASGVTDDITVDLGIDGYTPIGANAGCKYMYYMTVGISDTQAHGVGEYDIRYQILSNPNWTKDEKRELLKKFYADEDDYSNKFDRWEIGVFNIATDYGVDMDGMNGYTYEELLQLCGDKRIADIIWEEIEFCDLMYELRMPKSYQYMLAS